MRAALAAGCFSRGCSVGVGSEMFDECAKVVWHGLHEERVYDKERIAFAYSTEWFIAVFESYHSMDDGEQEG